MIHWILINSIINFKRVTVVRNTNDSCFSHRPHTRLNTLKYSCFMDRVAVKRSVWYPPFLSRLYDRASNRETLARRSFPGSSFYWSERCTLACWIAASFPEAAGNEPRLWSSGWSCIPGCTPPHPAPLFLSSSRSIVLACPPVLLPPLRPPPVTPPHKRITWVPKRAKRGSMARGR